MPNEIMEKLILLAQEASTIVMGHYNVGVSDHDVQRKPDNSPLTKADLQSNQAIVSGLEELMPGVPILSEEGDIPDYDERKDWKEFWLVDPLDGTKEFLKRNGEFTINIALIRNGKPDLGVLAVPAHDEIYFATSEEGAWRTKQGTTERIFSRPAEAGHEVTILESRSHRNSVHLKGLDVKVKDRIYIGSALKFAYLADGRAQLFFRTAPCSEWDVAAGDCLFRYSHPDGPQRQRYVPFRYNKESLLNGPFLIGFDYLPEDERAKYEQ